MSIKQSHSFSLGIVGLPNVGKSTIFNTLTQMSVPAENFPFCTIDKNVGVVEIPDKRLDRMVEHFNTEKRVPSAMTFVDIAGLVKGASKGEGLGNQFLSHIREVDVIMYVLRAFKSEKISHVYDRIDPIGDFEIVQSELILKDIESVEKRLGNVEKIGRLGEKEAVEEVSVLRFVLENLNNEIPVIDMNLSLEQKERMKGLCLLTNKKRMFVLNTKEGMEEEVVDNWKKELENRTKDNVLILDVKLLSDMNDMGEKEIEEYEELLGYKPHSITDVIALAFKTLDLITFYTGSKKECNAWSIVKGSNVREAAGVIHTDLEKGFVAADVVSLEEMLDLGGWSEAKDRGLVKNHSKDYIVQDGDYIVILANN